MSHLMGIAIESLVAVLLILTIGYCMLLNKRLKRLRADESSLKATIAELITATEIAERAIGGLKHTVRDVNGNLGAQLEAATEMSAQLKKQLGECDGVVRRMSKIAIAARPSAPMPEPAAAPAVASVPTPSLSASFAPSPTPAPIPSAKAVSAAAHAFSERRRSNGRAA